MTADSTERTVLLTGFPGFIGRQLLVRLARRVPGDRFVLLVEDRMKEQAEEYLTEMDRQELAGLAARCDLVVGDISRTLLGLEPERYRQLTEQVRQVWHLAAIYNLAVSAEVAHRINIIGTVNVLDFCEACGQFERLGYISTCYVSGMRKGLILETELDCGQTFKNHYESTKFWAELEVQRRRAIPTAIFRPGIVVGDSRTGATDKYDGPYFIMQLLRHVPSWLPLANVGRGEALVNIVPVDFAVDAMTEIFSQPDAVGRVYQLADPRAMKSRDIMAVMLQVMGKSRAYGSLPPRAITSLLSLRPVSRFLGLPREVIEYFNHEALYDSANTQKALAGTGIACPAFADYLPILYRYLVEHPKPGK